MKASAAYTICSIMQRGLSVLTLPFFTRLLSTEEYGLQTVYQSTMALLIIFTSLQLPYGSFSSAMLRYEKDRDGYVAAIMGLCTMLTVLFCAFYLPFRPVWNRWLHLPDFLVIVMAFEMLASTCTSLWMARERFEYHYKTVVAVTLASSLLSTALAFILVFRMSEKGQAKVLGHAVAVIGVGFAIYILYMIKGHHFYNKLYWKYALTFNIPLIPYYLSQMIFNHSDRLMIDWFCGRGDAAKYGVAYSLAFLLTFVLNAINNSFVPWQYENIKRGEGIRNKSVANAIALLMAVLLLGLIALAPEIILIMGGAKYAEATWTVPPVTMSLLLLFYTQLFVNVILYCEEKRYLVFGTFLPAITNILLNYILIPAFGFTAAGYTTLLSYVLFAICNYFFMVRACKKHGISTEIYDYKALLLLMVAFMGAGFLLTALYEHFVLRLGLIGIALFSAFVFRRKLNILRQKRLNFHNRP